MDFLYSRLRSRKLDERGINMVDLMMWLVIASLLLAAALQGIGYYRQSANLYAMKSDAMHAGETVAAKVSQNNGQFTTQNVTDGVSDSVRTQNMTITADSGANDGDGYVIRVTNPEITDKDVLFLSNQRGTYAPGVNIVPKGTVIAPDGTTSIPVAGGGGGSDATFTAISGSSTCSPEIVQAMNTDLAYEGSVLYFEAELAYQSGDSATGAAKYAVLNATPTGVSYNTIFGPQGPGTINAQIQALTAQRSDSGIPAYYTAYNDAANAFWGATPMTSSGQQAYITSINNMYTATCAAPLP